MSHNSCAPLSSTSSPNTTSTTISETSTSGTTPSRPNKTVTLQVENTLEGNNFNHSVTISSRERELIHFLKEAANRKPEFKFSATHYDNLGYFITAMNGLSSNERTYWKLLDGNGVALSLGVSSYVPKDGETIVFSYTALGPCH